MLLLACSGGSGSRSIPDDDPGTTTPTLPTLPTPPTNPDAPVELTNVTAALHDPMVSIVVVSWTQSGQADVHAEFFLDGEPVASSPVRSLSVGAHEELLVGIPFDVDVTWRLVAVNAAATTTLPDQPIHTGTAPTGLPIGDLLVADPARYDPDSPYFLTARTGSAPGYGDPYYSLIVDRMGRPVWAVATPPFQWMTMHPRVSRGGSTLLIDHNSYWQRFDGGADSRVLELTLDGAVVRTVYTPGLHHAFTDLPDGSIAYGRAVSSYSDEILSVIHPDGSASDVWGCEDWLSSIGIGGYCGSNTLFYDEASDHYLFSFYSFETIVEIDAATGSAVRWFGHAPGSYGFDPPESAFWWQHGGNWTTEGTLLTSSYLRPSGVEIVTREYQVDALTETLVEVASFGHGLGVFGEYMGEAHKLGNGNTLHNTGSDARLREFAPDGTVVWELAYEGAGEIGRSTPITDLWALLPPRP